MILPLEQQLTSLNLSKRLKELGVRQDSLFFWEESPWIIETKDSEEPIIKETKISLCMPPIFDLSRSLNYWSAFTSAELGMILPLGCRIHKERNLWIATTKHCLRCEGEDICFFDELEANARAKMAVHCIENKVIELTT